MKREFLENLNVNGAKLPKEIIDSIMDENGKDIQAGKNALEAKEKELATVTTERDGLKTQIADRDKDIADLQKKVGDNDELKNQLTTLQTKYNTDTSALQKKIDDQNNDYATEKFFSQFKFTSELAKKAAMADFKAQNFKRDDKGEFQGGKEWVEKLQKDNPTAFVTDDGNGGGAGNDSGNGGNNGAGGGAGNGNLPYFVAPTNNNGGNGGGGNETPFNFNFGGVRPAPTEQK